ncbi:endo-1,4-beta-xylanase [Parvularcula maris]|uniref:Beta-xylanase n=1 Tax=Parvularcula maris TaxID=2965077 RepID=A0A9X2RJP8_9PROT|nr:endo-1,4-beta-xylanase [Parvularcula maris]MCQ8186106.1 endo-1,4-beta-xylanase [Parvularcula maris]
MLRGQDRRQAMMLLGGGLLAAGCGGVPSARSEEAAAASLHELAAAKGLRFGTAMAARQLDDPNYVEIVKRECGAIVAENEHKIYTILAEEDEWNFGPADALARFAEEEVLAMRGHTLIWSHPRWLPDWLNNTAFDAQGAEAWIDSYVARVAGRYSPQVYSWDVINEAVDDKTGELRETTFTRAMGFDALTHSFHAAKEAAPGATLAYNDYMSWEEGNEGHRTGVLRLLERLKKDGAPIDALGIQSHSNYNMPNEFTAERQRAWRGFVDEVVGMGLDIYLTEFDVNDTRLGPDEAMRDRLIADYTKDYLDMMLSYPQTKDLLAWGMVDKDSWLQTFLPREDDVEKRPTVYDSDYQAKPMREAIVAALRAAPVRS